MKRIVSAVVFSALTFGLVAPLAHAADAPAAGATQKPAAVTATGTTATPVAKAGDVKQEAAKPATAATSAGTPVVKAGDQKPGEAKTQDVKSEGLKAGEVKQDPAAKPVVKPAS